MGVRAAEAALVGVVAARGAPPAVGVRRARGEGDGMEGGAAVLRVGDGAPAGRVLAGAGDGARSEKLAS